MNKFSNSYILFILLISTSRIIAQSDCHTAMELCSDSPVYIDSVLGEGLTDLDIENTCVEQEINSMWVKWTVLESGIITFVLTPDTAGQDIDFVVFQSESDYDCNNKTLIRCMAAGANSGQPPHEWVNCTGATGLSFGDTDVEEPPGCPLSSNNFLAPIQALVGDQYIMLINEFSGSGYGYTLSFGGTAVLNCNTVSTYPEEENPQLTFEVYPTVSNGSIYIIRDGAGSTVARLDIINMQGQLVYSKEQLTEKGDELDSQHLPQGAYFAVLRTGTSSQAEKFLIAK